MAWRRSPDSQPAVHAVQQKGKVFRKLIRFVGSPPSQHPARLATIRWVQADGARTAYALSRLGGYHGTSQWHLPFLHRIALQSVVSGDTFFLDWFATNTRLNLYAKVGDRKTAQQKGYQPYANKASSHCPLQGSVTIIVYLPARRHLSFFYYACKDTYYSSNNPMFSQKKVKCMSSRRPTTSSRLSAAHGEISEDFSTSSK